MKLEITDVMICEWDADTMCMIASPAEGWKVNVNYPISEAHASMVTMEKMEGPHIIDLKSLTGMWVKCTTEIDGVRLYKEGSWYQIGSDYWMESCWNIYGASEVFDLTDPRDYNPDELIGKWIKRTNQNTGEQSWGKLKEIGHSSSNDLNPIFSFEDGELWGKIACDVDNPMDYSPDERKPHQLQEYDAVECTPEERAEIIRIADECGVRVYSETKHSQKEWPYLMFQYGNICGMTEVRNNTMYDLNPISVPDFIAKIRGEYTENKVNVTEYKHESV